MEEQKTPQTQAKKNKTVLWIILGIVGFFIISAIIGVIVIILMVNKAAKEGYFDTENFDSSYDSSDYDNSTTDTTDYSDISVEQLDCAIAALGEERANEIMNGATPTTDDYIAISSCFE